MANITNYLNKIKTAVYGKDVRGAIHDAIKQVYDDASVNHDNANMEVKMARGTHNTLNDRLDNVDEIQAQTNAQLSDINMHTSGYININELQDLVIDNDWSFAINYAITNFSTVVIPDGIFQIKNPIIIPSGGSSQKTIKGTSSRSILQSFVSEDEFTIKTSGSVQKMTIENLQITSDFDANRGGIQINGTTRGITINNLWLNGLAYGVNCIGNMWGKSSFANIHILYLNPTATEYTYGFSVSGNTMFFDKVEVIGSYHNGFKAKNGRVFSLCNFNVAGSGTSYPITTALEFENIKQGKVSVGWIEGLEDSLGIGKQRAICLKDSHMILESVDCAGGSIYCDGGNYKLNTIYLGNNESSIRSTNSPTILIENLQHIKYDRGYCDYRECEAEYLFIGTNTSGTDTDKSIPGISKSNSSLVTTSDETLDIVSSVCKRVVANTNHGVRLSFTSLSNSKLYTVIADVKIINNCDCVFTKNVSGYTHKTGLARLRTYDKSGWIKLKAYVYSDESGTIKLDVCGTAIDTSQQCEFLISNAHATLGYS